MTRVQKVFLSIGLAALLLGGSVAILPSLLWGDRADYSHVLSIKDAREYQDPALLEKAWALPVAALYHSTSIFSGTSASAARRASSTYSARCTNPVIKLPS